MGFFFFLIYWSTIDRCYTEYLWERAQLVKFMGITNYIKKSKALALWAKKAPVVITVQLLLFFIWILVLPEASTLLLTQTTLAGDKYEII